MTVIEPLEVWLTRRLNHAELRARDAKTRVDRMYWSSRADALDDMLIKIAELKNEEDERNG